MPPLYRRQSATQNAGRCRPDETSRDQSRSGKWRQETLSQAQPDLRHWPIGWLAKNGPDQVCDAIFWYANLGSDDIYLPTDSSGTALYSAKERLAEKLGRLMRCY